MTIGEAIKWLEKLQLRHGPDVKVYFDCPACLQAFTPGTLEAKAIVITQEKK